MKNLWFKISHTAIARLFSSVADVLILVITARWLGPEGRGIISASVAWATMFHAIGHIGLGRAAIYRATQERNTPWLGTTLANLIVTTGVITAVGWVIAVLLYVATGGSVFGQLSPGILALGFLMLPFLVWETYGSSLLMSVDKLSVYNNAQMAARLISLVLVAVLIKLGAGVAGVLVAMLLRQIIVAIAGMRLLWASARERGRVHFEWSSLRSMLANGLKMHIGTVGTSLLTSIDIAIINYYCSLTETGLFQFARQLIQFMMILPEAVLRILFGTLAKEGPDLAWGSQRKVLAVTMGIMLALIAAAAIAAPVLIPLIAGDKFTESIPAFRILLIAVLGMALASVMSVQWVGRGWFWQAGAVNLVTGILKTGASFLLIPRYGMYGAIWGLIGLSIVSAFINGVIAVWCEGRYKNGYGSIMPQSVDEAK